MARLLSPSFSYCLPTRSNLPFCRFSTSSTIPKVSEVTNTPEPPGYKPYSPFQSTHGKLDYAIARMDDLINWARKVCPISFLTFRIPYGPLPLDLRVALLK
ncbi:unnamed protein product [Dicrocoelium dendriticum]|nr:unnamed protein product [Dicrocoelium dendriticum]